MHEHAHTTRIAVLVIKLALPWRRSLKLPPIVARATRLKVIFQSSPPRASSSLAVVLPDLWQQKVRTFSFPSFILLMLKGQEKICPGRFTLILTWREVDKMPKAVPAGLLHSCHPSAAESLPLGQLPVAVTTESLLLGQLPNTLTAEFHLLG
jgi:hypothetical protein